MLKGDVMRCREFSSERNAAGWRGLLKGVRRASVARSKRVVNEDVVEDRAPELQKLVVRVSNPDEFSRARSSQNQRFQGSESLGLGPSDALSVGLAISAPSAPAEPCLAGGGAPSPLGGGAG